MLYHSQGRFLNDGILSILSDPGEPVKFLIDTSSAQQMELLAHMKLYKLRMKVDIVASDSFGTVATVDADTANRLRLQRDPRVGPQTSLFRAVWERDVIANEEQKGSVTSHATAATALRRAMLLEAIFDGQDVTGRIPLECNVDMLHYVDFAKGCYVGQELTARTKHQVRCQCHDMM